MRRGSTPRRATSPTGIPHSFVDEYEAGLEAEAQLEAEEAAEDEGEDEEEE